MRILYSHRTQGVGAEGAHIMGMYEAFVQLGHNLSMHCLPGCDPFEKAKPAEVRQKRPSRLQRVYRFVAEHCPQVVFELFELAYNVPLFFKLGRACLKAKPDLMYERYSLNTFAPSLICRLLGIKHVLEVNDSVVIERSRPLAIRSLATAVEGYCLRSSHLAVTITEEFRARLNERFRLPASKVLVLANAVSKTRFSRLPDREGVRARLGVNGGFVLGGTGQFLKWHGLDVLVDQIGPVSRQRDLYFLFVGDGPARKDVMEAAARHEISDRVRFTGMLPVEEVYDYLSALDIAVIPSAAKHASPMKLLEYMAAGLPVVAPDLPSINTALPNDSMGRLFPPGDMERMRQAVLELLDDPESTRLAGKTAREHVFTRHTWDHHARLLLALLFPASGMF